MQWFRIDVHVLETYIVRSDSQEQAYENVGFITIRQAANNRTYSTQQYFAVLVLLYAVFHYSRFCVAFRDTKRYRLPYEFYAHTMDCALDRLFKCVRSRQLRSSKMYLALWSFFRHSGFEFLVAIYTEGHTLMHVRWPVPYEGNLTKLPESGSRTNRVLWLYFDCLVADRQSELHS